MKKKKKKKHFVKKIQVVLFFLQVQYGEDVKTQKKKALNTEGGAATENNKGKRSRRKAENVLR